MIIETDNYDFTPEYIVAVGRNYEPATQGTVIYVHLPGAGVRLEGAHARSFLWQWDKYKALSVAEGVGG